MERARPSVILTKRATRAAGRISEQLRASEAGSGFRVAASTYFQIFSATLDPKLFSLVTPLDVLS
jgi:hypothetical protein